MLCCLPFTFLLKFTNDDNAILSNLIFQRFPGVSTRVIASLKVIPRNSRPAMRQGIQLASAPVHGSDRGETRKAMDIEHRDGIVKNNRIQAMASVGLVTWGESPESSTRSREPILWKDRRCQQVSSCSLLNSLSPHAAFVCRLCLLLVFERPIILSYRHSNMTIFFVALMLYIYKVPNIMWVQYAKGW